MNDIFFSPLWYKEKLILFFGLNLLGILEILFIWSTFSLFYSLTLVLWYNYGFILINEVYVWIMLADRKKSLSNQILIDFKSNFE